MKFQVLLKYILIFCYILHFTDLTSHNNSVIINTFIITQSLIIEWHYYYISIPFFSVNHITNVDEHTCARTLTSMCKHTSYPAMSTSKILVLRWQSLRFIHALSHHTRFVVDKHSHLLWEEYHYYSSKARINPINLNRSNRIDG